MLAQMQISVSSLRETSEGPLPSCLALFAQCPVSLIGGVASRQTAEGRYCRLQSCVWITAAPSGNKPDNLLLPVICPPQSPPLIRVDSRRTLTRRSKWAHSLAGTH